MAPATMEAQPVAVEAAITNAATAHEAAAEAKATFDAITERLAHGDVVSATEFGQAELAVRLTATRARLAGEKAAEAAEARRLAQLAGFGDYAVSEMDPYQREFARARAEVVAAAVQLFEAMKAQNERFGVLLTELRALGPLPQVIRESMYSGTHFEAPGRVGYVRLRQLDTKSTVEDMIGEAYRAVFDTGSPFA